MKNIDKVRIDVYKCIDELLEECNVKCKHCYTNGGRKLDNEY